MQQSLCLTPLRIERAQGVASPTPPEARPNRTLSRKPLRSVTAAPSLQRGSATTGSQKLENLRMWRDASFAKPKRKPISKRPALIHASLAKTPARERAR